MMAKLVRVPHRPQLEGARVAVFGYDARARAYAFALRRAGNDVAIVRPDDAGTARADGFVVTRAVPAAEQADVIALFKDEPVCSWRVCAPRVAPGRLVIVARARALASGAFEQADLDIALLICDANEATRCRLAIHRDATGRALARAVAFAHAAHSRDVEVATTSVAFEIATELGAAGTRLSAPTSDDADGTEDNDTDDTLDTPFLPRSGAW